MWEEIIETDSGKEFEVWLESKDIILVESLHKHIEETKEGEHVTYSKHKEFIDKRGTCRDMVGELDIVLNLKISDSIINNLAVEWLLYNKSMYVDIYMQLSISCIDFGNFGISISNTNTGKLLHNFTTADGKDYSEAIQVGIKKSFELLEGDR